MFINAYKRAIDVILKKPFVLWGLSLMSGLITLIAGIVCGVVPALAIAVSYLIMAGMAKVYLDGLKGLEVRSEQLFEGFSNKAGRIAGALGWMNLWVIIWALIPIAGPFIAIVKSYSYSFVPYIVMTKPEVKATEALKLSMKMTKGKKGQMFLADLCLIVGMFIVFLVLALFSRIPFIGFVFRVILFVVYIVVVAFVGIFTGLYRASFYDEEPAPEKTAE